MNTVQLLQRVAIYLGFGLIANFVLDWAIFDYVSSHGRSLDMMKYVHLLKGFGLAVTLCGLGIYYYQKSVNQFQSAQRNYEELFRTSPNPIWVYDIISDEILDANDVACEAYGYSREDFMSRTHKSIVENIEDEELKLLKALIASENLEVHRSASGELKIVKVYTKSHMTGRRMTNTISAIDVTKEVHIEEKLQQLYADLDKKNAYLESLLNSQSSVIIFRMDMNGRITYTNDVFNKFFESIPDLSELKPVYPFLRKSDQTSLKKMILKMKDNTLSNDDQTIQIETSNGKHHISFEFILIKNKAGQPFEIQGIGKDITERIDYQNNIEKQNESLRRIAWIQSHELRAPLSRILGVINLHKESAGIIKPSEVLDAVYNAANQLDEVIHKIVQTSEKTTHPAPKTSTLQVRKNTRKRTA